MVCSSTGTLYIVVDQDPYVPFFLGPLASAAGSVSHKYGSGSGFFHHQAKTLISTCYLYDYFPVFRIRMFFSLPDPHPDPLDRGADPRIRIRTKNATDPQHCLLLAGFFLSKFCKLISSFNLRMRSSLVVRASDCQCTSCNCPGFDLSIRRHSGI
jgi:hypothetical protein